jgi:hypothetical protein
VNTDSITIELGRPIAFRTLGGDSLAAHAVALTLRGDAKSEAARATLVFRVAFDVYTRILAQSLFELEPGVRPPTPFEVDRDIEIEARLAPDLVAALLATGAGAQDLVDSLTSETARLPLLRVTTCWQALSVMQPIDAPPGVEGTLQSGFKTTIEDDAEPTMFDVADRAARRAGTPLEETGEGLYRFEARAGARTWSVLVWIDEEKRSCAVFSVLPELVEPERRAVVAQYLVDRNYYLTVGGFEMDLDDGEVRFRTSVDAANATFDEALFVNLVSANLSMFGLFQDALRGLATGTLTLDEARGLHA